MEPAVIPPPSEIAGADSEVVLAGIARRPLKGVIKSR